jgi:hypothetical protein
MLYSVKNEIIKTDCRHAADDLPVALPLSGGHHSLLSQSPADLFSAATFRLMMPQQQQQQQQEQQRALHERLRKTTNEVTPEEGNPCHIDIINLSDDFFVEMEAATALEPSRSRALSIDSFDSVKFYRRRRVNKSALTNSKKKQASQ